MALATRCPYCHTAFRVVPDQLKLRSGIVRCGHCQQVFNGIEHLIRSNNDAPQSGSPAPEVSTTHLPEPDAALPLAPPPLAGTVIPDAPPPPVATKPVAPATPPAPPAPPARPAPAPQATDPAPGVAPAAHSPPPPPAPNPPVNLSGSPAAQRPRAMQEPPHAPPPAAVPQPAPLPETLPLAEVLAQARIEPTLDQATWPDGKNEAGSKIALDVSAAVENLAQASHDAEHGTQNGPEEAKTADDAEEPSFVRSARRAQKYRGLRLLLQSLTLLLLLALLLGQAIYTWRDLIAVRWPVTRGLLDRGCALLHCQIGLPTQISQLSIELGELQALKRGKETFSYSTLLRNTGTIRQSWPHIELTLQDDNGRPVAKRVFEPKSYLLPGELAKGFPGQSEQAVKLYFETTQLKAANFHATIFYP